MGGELLELTIRNQFKMIKIDGTQQLKKKMVLQFSQYPKVQQQQQQLQVQKQLLIQKIMLGMFLIGIMLEQMLLVQLLVKMMIIILVFYIYPLQMLMIYMEPVFKEPYPIQQVLIHFSQVILNLKILLGLNKGYNGHFKLVMR